MSTHVNAANIPVGQLEPSTLPNAPSRERSPIDTLGDIQNAVTDVLTTEVPNTVPVKPVAHTTPALQLPNVRLVNERQLVASTLTAEEETIDEAHFNSRLKEYKWNAAYFVAKDSTPKEVEAGVKELLHKFLREDAETQVSLEMIVAIVKRITDIRALIDSTSPVYFALRGGKTIEIILPRKAEKDDIKESLAIINHNHFEFPEFYQEINKVRVEDSGWFVANDLNVNDKREKDTYQNCDIHLTGSPVVPSVVTPEPELLEVVSVEEAITAPQLQNVRFVNERAIIDQTLTSDEEVLDKTHFENRMGQYQEEGAYFVAKDSTAFQVREAVTQLIDNSVKPESAKNEMIRAIVIKIMNIRRLVDEGQPVYFALKHDSINGAIIEIIFPVKVRIEAGARLKAIALDYSGFPASHLAANTLGTGDTGMYEFENNKDAKGVLYDFYRNCKIKLIGSEAPRVVTPEPVMTVEVPVVVSSKELSTGVPPVVQSTVSSIQSSPKGSDSFVVSPVSGEEKEEEELEVWVNGIKARNIPASWFPPGSRFVSTPANNGAKKTRVKKAPVISSPAAKESTFEAACKKTFVFWNIKTGLDKALVIPRFVCFIASFIIAPLMWVACWAIDSLATRPSFAAERSLETLTSKTPKVLDSRIVRV